MAGVPYTYLLRCNPENSVYYGVRYADDCSPEDFWVTYFTSSKTVKEKIELYGLDAFVFEIRRVFDNKESAILWENRVLTRMRVLDREDFYNKTTNKAFRPLYGSNNPAAREEIRAKISKTLKETAVRGDKHPRRISPEKYDHIGNMLRGRDNVWSRGDLNPMHRADVKEKFANMRGSHPNNGRVQTSEEKEQRRISNLGKTRQKYKCVHCGSDVAQNMLLRWHNDNCKKANK